MKIFSVLFAWKFSENGNIVCYLEEYVVSFGSDSQKVLVIFYMNSENMFTLVYSFCRCEYCLIWTMKKCVVSFGSNSLKSEKVLTVVGINCLKVWILFCFFGQMLYYCMLQVFMNSGFLIKTQFFCIWIIWNFSCNLN